MPATRGIAISAYLPPFSKGAKVYGENIQSGVITSAHIQDGTVVAADVKAGAITSAKLGAGAVVASKIGAAAVTSAAIGAAAVVAANIGAGAVTSAKIGAGAVKYSKTRSFLASGTLATDSATVAIAHGLSAVPSLVIVTLKSTAAKLNSNTSSQVGEASASARTTANVYIAGSGGTGYQVYCLV